MIVLSVIVVGVSVAVGIGQFQENAMTSNRDAVAADCQRIISSSQQWLRKPASMGGGANTFTGLSLGKVGIKTDNQNGAFALTVDSANQITIVGTGTEKNAAGAAIKVTMEYYTANDSTAYTDNI
jgi:hypothetical protein